MTEQSTYEEAKLAVYAELESRDYGTSTEDIEAYAGVAGGTVAAGVCAAYGAAVASPACYAVGEFLGEYGVKYAVKAWNYLFSDDEEYKKYLKRQAEKAELAVHRVGIESIDLVYWSQFQDSIYKMMIMHHELWPGQHYSYVKAVNDLVKVSEEIDRPVILGADSYNLNLSFLKLKVDLPDIIKGPPFFGKQPQSVFAIYSNILLQYPNLEDSETVIFNKLMKDTQNQINNIQDSYSAAIALFIAGYEVELGFSPEAKAIIDENKPN